MKWVWGMGAALAGLALFVWVAGSLLPVRHESGRSARLQAAPEAVWEVIAAVEEYPRWRPEVKKVEIIREAPRLAWKEWDSAGEAIAYEAVEIRNPEKWVSRIADSALPFGGTWTFHLILRGKDGTELIITENGEIYNPVFRFMARFFFGYTGALDAYLYNLKRRLAE